VPVSRLNCRCLDLARIVSGRIGSHGAEEECQVNVDYRWKMSSSTSESAKSPLDEHILGCSGSPMQTAFMILAVLVATLALPVVAGTVYQVIETWRAGPASKDASQSVSRDARGNDWHNALASGFFHEQIQETGLHSLQWRTSGPQFPPKCCPARVGTNFFAYRIGGILSDKWRSRTVPVTRCPKPYSRVGRTKRCFRLPTIRQPACPERTVF